MTNITLSVTSIYCK